MIIVWKLVKRTTFVKATEMDLETDVYTKNDMEPVTRNWKRAGKRIATWFCF